MIQPFFTPIRRWLTPCTLLAVWLPASLTALTAQAQPGALSTTPDPLDPKAGIPTLSYQSSFSQYRRLDDGKLISWRDANDTVTRIGGWRVYAREAQQPDAAPAAPSAVPNDKAKPTPAEHGGHKTP